VNDERSVGESIATHLHWLVTHPAHTALANGTAATVLGMTVDLERLGFCVDPPR
jgi:hypothetical protein